jgi:hypothetical protein
MKHDESALVKQALHDAREQLRTKGRILPATYMLVTNNPQTGARLTHPTAIGAVQERAFASPEEYAEFLSALREEIGRLDALAVALAGEASAEVETHGGVERRRVFYLRIEDQEGVEQLHAPIQDDGSGHVHLGDLLADAGAEDMLEQRLLAARA